MSDEKKETSTNIIAEMRNLGKLDEKSIDRIPRTLMGLGLRTYADRLEAALKRELESMSGNAAAMREALEPWIAFAEWLLENAGKDGLGKAIQENGPIIRQRLEELREALSAPPRNCDKYANHNDAMKAFEAFVREQGKLGFINPYTEAFKWLFAPSTEKEGGASE